MAQKLTLTGVDRFSSPLTYGVVLMKNQIVNVSDTDAVTLLAMTSKPLTGAAVPLFTAYVGGAAADVDLSTQSNFIEYNDGSVSATPAQVAAAPSMFPRGQLLRDRQGFPYGYSDGVGGTYRLARYGDAPLAALIGANFNVATDQSLWIRPGVLKFRPNKIIVTGASVSLTTAAGGIYSAATKGGSAIVAAAQAYSALTAPTKALLLTLAVTDTVFQLERLYLSLTTPQGAAATANVFVFGEDLS